MERGEQLSALLDGELDQLAAARLMRALGDDEQALDDWEHYALIGDVLREHEGVAAAGRLGARRALAQIAEEAAPRRSWRSRMPEWRGLVPWGMAASAALMALVMNKPLAFLEQIAGNNPPAAPAYVRVAGSQQMARYIDFHREVAGAGLERTTFALAGDEGGQGR